MPKVKRGEIWEANFEPKAYKAEPGKTVRPALVIQTNALNDAGHATTIVIPGTTNIQTSAPDEMFPLRVRVQKQGGLTSDTDLMIDQVRAIANARITSRLCALSPAHLKQVLQALAQLTI